MYSPFQLAWRYLRYYITASNGRGHGMHSPFVYELITAVLNDDRFFYRYDLIEAQRAEMLHNKTLIVLEDFGAGSRLKQRSERTVSAIAKSSLKPKKYSQLLFRLVNHFGPENILELGTSLGITSSYLASARPEARVITMEGSAAVAAIASKHFNYIGLNNIEQVIGNFDETLAPILSKLDRLDFIFIDGNHRYEPTMRYFEQVLEKCHENTLIIFDDIHWSAEMERAWEQVKVHTSVTLTIDLFFVGLVFFRKEQKAKQHFTVRF
ncbi:MAG: class I SAM-dependent methyltransferase [Sphingobacteriia bacterium]|nr:MAG: class I SAM-dependent methyltransferase [Sphingobacteriia bacterium]TAH06713.1 MAG: class I SAM-dependent methyltransferase [Sphingobacteriia bacterium]